MPMLARAMKLPIVNMLRQRVNDEQTTLGALDEAVHHRLHKDLGREFFF
jgi:hypothetical protein